MNAAGNSIPQLIISPRVRMKPELKDSAPRGAIAVVVSDRRLIQCVCVCVCGGGGGGYSQAATPINAINGFQKTGIWPLSRSVFSDVDFAASKPTYPSAPQPDENSVGSDEDDNEPISALTDKTSTLALES